MLELQPVFPLSWTLIAQMIELLPDGVMVVDEQGMVLRANAAMEALSGYPSEALVGQPLTLLLPPEQRQRHQRHLQQYFVRPRSRAMGRVPELSLWHREGHGVPVDISLGMFRRGEQTLTLAVVRDMRAIEAMNARLRHLAMHDSLTELFSRAMFGELLTQAVEHTRRGGLPVSVLLIDLDDFKSVNDGHGHHVGDELLREVAQRMRRVLRASDTLARLGGDEFAVLLRDQSDAGHTLAVAQKLVDTLSQPWQTRHHEIFPGASIGIVFAPHDGEDADTLMRHADMAMYRAKEAGRSTYAVFDARMAHQMEEKTLLHGRLKRAIEGNALRLHYQPQLCARSGQVVGVEALLRWSDPELGEVTPGRFISVAENSGLIQRLGDWVIEAACAQIARWRWQGLALRVAVNVSAHQLRQPHFADRLQQSLERWDVPPSLLELEITETAAMTHREQAEVLLGRLAEMGVALALDDFGTGYSSLGHLRQMPVTRLKMDRAFIQGVTHDEADATLTRAIIGLARTLGKTVVAEGVETEAQRDFLQREGCDELQGWLFARAVPAEEVPALLGRLNPPRAGGDNRAHHARPGSGPAEGLSPAFSR
ncbi:EAL domain-containing protein [Pelomonas sp. CA6]|uniref:putative bifunctional diguanylate cyclase/phosphodiesterase n=1 Tax=Pelomonas sp. CA6 TaxID=2907999 RepID=UPI001F4A532A|nr:EAL domain-containing protein [Pelomonas sp. CA6]MCH7342803.1 EAL domain-containing protein [Pelomonas sp. CA6]